MAIFSFSRSRSISAAPSRAFSRSLSSSSPVAGFVVSAASPAARNASRQAVSVAAVTPSPRDTVSRSSPRNSRSTAATLRGRDILPPRPGAATPDSCGRSASPGRVSTFVSWSMIHLSRGNRPLTRCPNQLWGGGRLRDCLEAAALKEPLNANVWVALAVVVGDQRINGWGLPADEASIEKRSHLADRELQETVRAADLAPQDARAQSMLAHGYHAECQLDRFRIEAEKAVALNPYDTDNIGWLGILLAFSGFWDEGTAFAEKAIKLKGPAASPFWWLAPAKRHWLRGEYQEAYDAFQHSYLEWYWLSHLDLAYTLPFLGRTDEAKAHVATLLKMYPTMSVAEADAYYRLLCFEPAFREKMARALRQAGLPEGEARSN